MPWSKAREIRRILEMQPPRLERVVQQRQRLHDAATPPRRCAAIATAPRCCPAARRKIPRRKSSAAARARSRRAASLSPELSAACASSNTASAAVKPNAAGSRPAERNAYSQPATKKAASHIAPPDHSRVFKFSCSEVSVLLPSFFRSSARRLGRKRGAHRRRLRGGIAGLQRDVLRRQRHGMARQRDIARHPRSAHDEKSDRDATRPRATRAAREKRSAA